MDLSLETVLNLNNLTDENLIVVEEQQYIDGGFVISSILENHIKRCNRLVFLLFHQTFGHYHGVGVKLGYNLMKYKQEGKIQVIDCLFDLCYERERHDKSWAEDKLKAIFLKTEEAVERFKKEGAVTIVLEHPTNVIITGGDVSSVMFFGMYMRSLISPGVNLLCLIKTLPNCRDLSAFASSLHHRSSLSVQVKGLATGCASDINGMIVVLRKSLDDTWDQENCYHFLLLDKRIRLFAPGFVQIR